ncbi:hypothetical protein CONCODRAFT_13522, partial [Conidiobolus coronatus NRRL 28638]
MTLINNSNLVIKYWNCRGIGSKYLDQYLLDYPPSIDYDILFLSETWFIDLPFISTLPTFLCHSIITPRIYISDQVYSRHTAGLYCLIHPNLKPYIKSFHTTPYSITLIFQPPNPLNFNSMPSINTIIPSINPFNSMPSTSNNITLNNINSSPSNTILSNSMPSTSTQSPSYKFNPITIQAVYIPPNLNPQDLIKFITPPFPIDVLIGDINIAYNTTLNRVKYSPLIEERISLLSSLTSKHHLSYIPYSTTMKAKLDHAFVNLILQPKLECFPSHPIIT